MLIDIIAGARPNFMKVAPIIRSIEARAMAGASLEYRLIHTGQHYDKRMSDSFFEQLGMPAPHLNLEVGSGPQAAQAGAIMERYERVLLDSPPNMCLVVGDVTSTMACAIAAKKMGIAVAHVEAGIRSGDITMPEEINRILTDSITDHFFTTTRQAGENLKATGALDNQIHFVGNTMIDTLLINIDRLRAPDVVEQQGLQAGEFFVATLHRPANVDVTEQFCSMMQAIAEGASGHKVVFPVHPRTAKNLQSLNGIPDNLVLIEPQPYLEFIWLVKNAKAVITDSGGVTEEATVLNVPCLTLRNSTERPETVDIGTNVLVGTDPAAVGPALKPLFGSGWKSGAVPELWDGKASERIVDVLEAMAREKAA